MPDVKIRVEAVSRDETNTQKQGEEVAGAGIDKEKLVVASLFAHQAVSTAKQITSYAISNIGNFTGDYIQQDRVQKIVGGLTDLAALGVAAATSPAALAVASIGLVTRKVFEIVSDNQEVKHAERNANYLRIRSGNSTTNGSR